jgi:hypothetical protein
MDSMCAALLLAGGGAQGSVTICGGPQSTQQKNTSQTTHAITVTPDTVFTCVVALEDPC